MASAPFGIVTRNVNGDAERRGRCGTPRAMRNAEGGAGRRGRCGTPRAVRDAEGGAGRRGRRPLRFWAYIFVIHGRLGRRNAAPTVVLGYISGVRKDRARPQSSVTGAGQGLCRTLSAAKLFPSAGQRPSASPSYSENLPQYPFPSGSGLSCAYPLP